MVQSADFLSPGTEGELMIENFCSRSVGEALLGYRRFQHEPVKPTFVGFVRSDVESGDWFLSRALKVLAR